MWHIMFHARKCPLSFFGPPAHPSKRRNSWTVWKLLLGTGFAASAAFSSVPLRKGPSWRLSTCDLCCLREVKLRAGAGNGGALNM